MADLTIAEVLTRAADLIEPEGAWTQGDTARDADGKPLPNSTEPAAVCWCVLGAIGKTVGGANRPMFSAARKALRAVLPEDIEQIDEDLPDEANWNDAPERTQAEVVAALRAAAEKARQS